MKKKAKGEVEKYKVRLVAKGFTQRVGIDYDEVFAKLFAKSFLWLLNKDGRYVKLTFLNGTIEEEIYVKQPLEYNVEGQGDKVLKLKKDLHGLKQAPRP